MTFSLYSAYYDLFYGNKSYEAEVSYILGLTDFDGSGEQPMLELGCGTGGHALELSKRGITVHGVDASEEMIAISAAKTLQDERLSFEQCLGQEFSSETRFGGAISLFHVVSYLQENDDLLAFFRTVKKHLLNGAPFVFDFWYGPGVLGDPPGIRNKSVENDLLSIRRKSTPKSIYAANCVSVTFDVEVTERDTGKCSEFSEKHVMRYLFQPELNFFLQLAGFSDIRYFNWMENSALDGAPWYACCVAR